MSKNQNTGVEYYKKRGVSRSSLVMSLEHKQSLDKLTKENHVAIGDVVEALLDILVISPRFEDLLEGKLEEKREAKAKVDGRASNAPKREIMKSMSGLTDDQLASIEAQISKMKEES